ncbi:hypothetical protein [uncultured Cohaesibacter sp.]|uniref:hypothetical protein n=1 Tax=uncultured Cohaesibacter sp. TaxID=1002546 RepID=UPI0029C789A1|nr:hypothetical protein [uncultured Cohaesibacter sp.]
MKKSTLALVFFAAFSFALPSLAQSVYTPQRGAPERKQILDAIRPLLEVRLEKPIEFVVNWLNVYDGWAFVSVDPQRPGGGKIDGNTATYQMWEHQDGLTTYVLLKHDYGQWNLVDYAIGPTDAFWHGAPLYSQFPEAFTNP